MKIFVILTVVFVNTIFSFTAFAQETAKDNFVTNETKLSIVGSSVTVSITTADGQTIKYSSDKRVKVFFQMQDEIVSSTGVVLAPLSMDGVRVVSLPNKGWLSRWASEWPAAAATVADSLKEGVKKAMEKPNQVVVNKPPQQKPVEPVIAESSTPVVNSSTETFDNSCETSRTGYKAGDVTFESDGRKFVWDSPCSGHYMEEETKESSNEVVESTVPYVVKVKIKENKPASKEGAKFVAKGAKYIPTPWTVYIFDQCPRYLIKARAIGDGKTFEDIRPGFIKPINYEPRMVIVADIYTNDPVDPKLVMKGKPQRFEDGKTWMLYLQCGEPLQWVKTKDLKEFPDRVKKAK